MMLRKEEYNEKDYESRKEMLVAIAIDCLRENAGFIDSTFHYDGAECDAYCVADDLADEFELYNLIG